MKIEPEYNPSRSLSARITRRLTQWNTVEALGQQPKRTIVSVTFDDFPKSAANLGSQIVMDAGGRATYYACTSLLGGENITGEQFDESTIAFLQKDRHEIGAHSHSHLDCAIAEIDTVEADILLNLKRLKDMGVPRVSNFAYPFGETQVELKRTLRTQFRTARGILAGTNGARSDRMQLRALELTPNDWTFERAAKAIRESEDSPSWVILFTHDVRKSPSRYGVHPDRLKELLQMACDINAEILTVGEAIRRLEVANDV